MGIRARIAVLTALGLLVAVGLTSILMLNGLRSSQTNMVRERIIIDAEQTARIAEPHLLDMDQRELDELVEMTSGGGVISVHIINAEGRIVASSEEDAHAAVTPIASMVLRTGRPVIGPVRNTTWGAVPIIGPDNRTIGVVVEEIDTSDTIRNYRAAEDMGIASVAIAAIAGLGLAYILASFITMPLYSLLKAIRSMAAGQYDVRAPMTSTPELREIAQAFNSMAIAVTRRINNLEILNRMAADISLAGSPAHVAEAVYSTCAVVLGGEARLWIYEPLGQVLQSVPVPGGTGRIQANAESPVSQSAREGRIIVIGKDGNLPPGTAIAQGLPYVDTAIIIPLETPTGVVGVMSVSFDKYQALQLDQEQANFAVVVASIAGPAVASIQRAEAQARSARMLQRILVPRPPVQVPGISVDARYEPAEEIGRLGGDYYDFIRISEDRWCFVVGDVGGKGLPAAQFAAMAKFVVRSFVLEYGSPGEALSHTNSSLVTQMPGERFITLFCGIYDARTHILLAARAGHPPPIVYHSRMGTVHELRSSGPVAGVFPDAEFQELEEFLESDDVVVIFTDGVTEARGKDGLYGEKRLIKILIEHAALSAEEIADAIMNDIRDFSGGKLTDDTALVVIKLI